MGKEAAGVGVTFARQMTKARKARGWSTERLEARLRELGFDEPSAGTLRKIEAGGRQRASDADSDVVRTRAENVRLEEVIACAMALNVAVANLLCPLEPDEWVQVGTIPMPAKAYRSWLHGVSPPPGSGSEARDSTVDDWAFFYLGFVPEEQRRYWRMKAAQAEGDGTWPEALAAPIFLAKQSRADLAYGIQKAEEED